MGYNQLKTALLTLAVAGLFAVLTSPVAWAGELVMFEEDGCMYCEMFNEEVAPAWPNTAEGKANPLRRVDIFNGIPKDLKIGNPVTVSPTFILVDDKGVEQSRLVGYPGADFWWWFMGDMVAKGPQTGKTGTCEDC